MAIKNLGTSTMRVKEGLYITGSVEQTGGSTLQDFSLINSGSIYNQGNIFLDGKESGSDETYIQFMEAGGDRAKVGINTSNNLVLENQYINKHIVFKVNDQGNTREGLRIDGAVPEVVVNEGSESLVDFRVESNNQTHMLFVDGGNDRVGIGTSSPANKLHVYGNTSNEYVALIDSDQGSNGHGLKVTSDGTGTGTYILDVEAASSTIFRVRGDGRVGIGVETPGSTLSVDDEIAVGEKLIHRGDPDTYLQFPANDTMVLAAGGDDAITIEDGGYVKFHTGVKYSRGVRVSNGVSPTGDSNPNKDGGWIKFASAIRASAGSNLDTTASSFLITLAGTESSTNRRLDGTFLVHAKYTNNNDGNGDGNSGQYHNVDGTFIYCEALNADFLSGVGGHAPTDFDPSTGLLMIFTDDDDTPTVDLYIKACAKDKECFVTHIGGTGNIDTNQTDPGFVINTGQSWSATEPAAPGGSVKKTGTWASKVFSNATVTSVLAVKEMLDTKAMMVNVRDVNSTSSVQATDYVLRCIQNQAITITLPAKNTSAGRVLVFKDAMGNASTNNITLDGDSSDTIDGNATYVMSHNKESVTLTCDGINGWMMTSRVRP